MNTYKKVFLLFLGLTLSHICYAALFNIIPKAGTTLPTTVSVGSTVTAFYTVSNNTLAQRVNNFAKYLPPNVTQDTSGVGVCGSTFTLAGRGQTGDSCTLQLTVSGAVNGSDPNPAHHLFVCFPGGLSCSGTNYPLNVTQTSQEKTLSSIAITPSSTTNIEINQTKQFTATATYSDGSTADVTSSVTWQSSTPTTATISSAGLATGAGIGSTTVTATLDSITSNSATLTITFTYVTQNAATGVAYAPIKEDLTLNSFTATTTISGTGSFRGIAFNQTNKLIYVGGGTTVITACTINNNGTIQQQGAVPGNCNNFTGSFPSSTSGIAINSTETRAYVTDTGGAPMSSCAVNSNGTLSGCTTTMSQLGGANSAGIVINPEGTFAYIANRAGNRIFACAISSTTGLFTSCTNTGAASLNSPQGITIHPSLPYVYIANTGGAIRQIVKCTIASSTVLNSCAGTGTMPGGFSDNFSDVKMNSAGTQVYMVTTNGNAYSCPVQSDGTLGTCSNATSTGFGATSGIGVF